MIGPVLMIIIVTTVSVYLAVYKGVELETDEPDAPRKKWWPRRQKDATAEPESDAEPEPATPPDVP